MGPPRRTPKTKNPSLFNLQKQVEPVVPHEAPEAQHAPSLGMAPETRYQHNLKVLRRRDPTIVSIFDQFSHICVYECRNTKWEKVGCEGSMFLFESSTYPPYGFYILNRTGMHDHIARLYPEDFLSAHGPILAIRHFSTFTKDRLAGVKASLEEGEPLPGPYDSRYIVPDVDSLTHEMKGEHSLMGLWMHSNGNREHLSEVMKRLHSYIKSNERYPEEYRYGPGHPPPPNRLNALPRSASSLNVTSSEASDSQASQESSSESDHKPPESDVERLFAKLIPSSAPHSAPPEGQHGNNVTVDSLFAKLKAPEVPHSAPITPAPAPTGIKLLDTLFASAASANLGGSKPLQVPQPTEPKIYSPTPTVSTTPQVLNQDVISTLLGLPPSRSASAASTTNSVGARSHTSRDGDNEEDSDPNMSPTHFGQLSGESRPASTVGNTGLLGVPDLGNKNKLGRINGDVTPRAFTISRLKSPIAPPSVIETVSSVSTVRGSNSHTSGSAKPRANRPLVPFESDSELWPYPLSQGEYGESYEESDIVELDFEETSLLSDPDALSRAFLKKKAAPLPQVNGHTHPESSAKQAQGKSKRKKGSRMERDARERAELEKSWDVPEYMVNYTAQAAMRRQQLASPPASPSPPISPPPVRIQTPSLKGVLIEAATPASVTKPSVVVNGSTNGHVHDTPNAKAKKLPNGANKSHTLDKDLTKNCIISSVDANTRSNGKMGKSDFVREVLNLIRSDKGFVDDLYQQYMSRLA
ncbi:hypothetical protein FA15DRAFT_659026 [Coprinopsis marcescibilis]|uniref:PH domain-like protein n=1 Tax=Coprinopsis marcescibilis TaxID=230819 RepID=A0A5C3KJN7_COPMA|nr:hypothetical protein FA15DRAFT_659026 [Coprinopsis marcescibilis]